MVEADGEHDDEDTVAAAFLVEWLADCEQGIDRSLTEYQERYPGFEELIEREYQQLQRPSTAPADTMAGPPKDRARYQVEREIGRGGMGSVHRVFEQQLQRHLALKRVRPGASARELRRFVEEARITAQLHHPGIVPVHEFAMDETGRMYFTMDLVQGRTFQEVIHKPPRTVAEWNRVLEIAQRICEAVAFAHSKGIVHRDLKPQNVMVGRFGEVYVMDWGLARVADARLMHATLGPDPKVPSSAFEGRREIDRTMAGDIVGTPAYMAPEQARNPAEIDARADVYAVGAMLYQALTGRMPYVEEGAATTSRSILDRITREPPKPVQTLAPDAQPELVAICEKAMARHPDDRYRDLLALRDELRAYVDGRVVRTYERGTWAELRKWIRRNRLSATAATLAVLALVVALVITVHERTRASTQAVRAGINFDHAIDAVEQLLARVGEEHLQDVPGASKVRRQLLIDAVDFYERLLVENPGDVALRRRAASVNRQVTTHHERMGDRVGADRTSARALELRTAEVARAPNDPDALAALADSHNQIGTLQLNRGHYADAVRSFGLGLDEIQRSLGLQRSARSLKIAGMLRHNLSINAMRQKQLDVAKVHAQAALRCYEDIGTFEDVSDRLATAYLQLGAVLHGQRDFEGCRIPFRRAVELRRRTCAREPASYEARQALASALTNQAIGEADCKDLDAAMASLNEAIELRRAHADLFPSVPESWIMLGASLSNRSTFERRFGNHDAAMATCDEAIEALERGVAMDPSQDRFHRSLLLARSSYHRAAGALNNHPAIAANARAAAASTHANERLLRSAAYWMATAVRLVAKDQTLRTTERDTLIDRYTATAIKAIEEVHRRGELERGHLESPRLQPLRSHPRIQALATELDGGKE